jgi:hypothetical protein
MVKKKNGKTNGHANGKSDFAKGIKVY